MGAGQPAVEEAGAPEAGMGRRGCMVWGTGVGMGVAWVWGRDGA